MQDAVPRNLRSAERFLLAPPLAALFGGAAVSVCDISAKGARFKHAQPLEMGMKSLLRVPVDGRQVSFEAVVVWTQAEAAGFTSGVRSYGGAEVIEPLLAHLHASHRSARIEELRSTDRFHIAPALAGVFGSRTVSIVDLSARGARLDGIDDELTRGTSDVLHFRVPGSSLELAVTGSVAWASAKKCGLFINEKPELLRLAIGQLCETNRAALDTSSLRLKLRILRARARQLAPSLATVPGIAAEEYLLVHGVREELRLNPEEALHWYRRARLVINDPATRAAAPAIADHPDALAVWEYLDRSVDPAVVGRAFSLPAR